MSPFLRFSTINKSFGGIHALRDVSLEIEGGVIVGLVGENGAGKSTLMNVLGGVLEPDSGEIHIEGTSYAPQSPRDATRWGVAFIHQELNLFTNLTVAENLFIDGFPTLPGLPFVDRRRVRRETEDALHSVQLEIAPGTRVETLSPGQRQLIEIVKALRRDARLIVFDEPTTSLTSKETEKLFGIIRGLKAAGKTIIFISHILNDVEELADFIVVLRDGQVQGHGPIGEFPINRMISLMVGRDIRNLYPERSAHDPGPVLLSVEKVSQPGIVRDIDLVVRSGEIVGVFGLMGSGRTELARIIFGLDPQRSGQIRLKDRTLSPGQIRERIEAGMAFVTEERREEGLVMDLSVQSNLVLVTLRSFLTRFGGLTKPGLIAMESEKIVEQLRIKTAGAGTTPVKSLSGGNQQKTVIGKWLLSRPDILILDEPTRGVDVGAKYEVHAIVQKLAENGAGVLMISSELDELIGTADRIVVMSRGELTGEFPRDSYEKELILAAAFRQSVVMSEETGAGGAV
ncbi:MAG: sugar ABC transporter ATP-binding protein [Spirochaetaceae bacterium]|nr:MAG: sugar ABC transporter ATP-binding protein [Spirochaetaceae bacterium]